MMPYNRNLPPGPDLFPVRLILVFHQNVFSKIAMYGTEAVNMQCGPGAFRVTLTPELHQ